MRIAVWLIFLCGGALAPVAGAVAQAPRSGNGPVLAVFLPWQDAAARVAAAGGAIVGPREALLGVLAAGPSGFPARLEGEGALTVLDARALDWICGG
ncbi:hypothetical protein [Tranquillimonas alkanivorans]|uniref:Uncharacterized protein n=1 Tax=Tranquillimonas alkanivorans TaxID=441119 RepID=A0A1I5KSH7_9RHOB|nr:hypothetical protein [Tranquillimonas alkanivorans]SFO88014.1 hypothetical protein SAMN04488047_101291 [Tranquillimonas alkanivorans]